MRHSRCLTGLRFSRPLTHPPIGRPQPIVLNRKEARRSRQRRRKTWIALAFRSSIDSNPTRPVARPRSGRAECGRAIVVILTVEQRSTTVPAHAHRHRRRLAARQDLTIVRQVDDVAGRRYVFFNHGCSSRLRTAYRRQVSRKRSAHRSNFTGGIGALSTHHRAAAIPLYSATPTIVCLRPA